jgi:dTDP-4-amino-4,6-dideoxygalactose transaminase
MDEFIPFSRPSIGDEEIAEVVDTLKNGWLTTGPKTKRFEEEFASFVGSNFAIAVNSATAGLHLALEALGVVEGDKVVTTTFTFTATAEVIRYLGADPILIDIDPSTYNMDVKQLERALKSNSAIKAIIPVHYAGQACNMSQILQLAEQFDVKIVEDAAHAFPTTSNGRLVGTIGDITVFSFYANKTMTTGEGGMITTNDREKAERMRTMRLHGISRDVSDRYWAEKPSWYYEVVAPGFKYNLTDVASSIGLHQLKKIRNLQAEREMYAKLYDRELRGLPLVLPIKEQECDMHAWHLYALQIIEEDAKITRNEFVQRLYEKRIAASVHFIPLHMQPYWRDRYHLTDSQFPVATSVYKQILSLPLFAGMGEHLVMRVVKAVKEILRECQ